MNGLQTEEFGKRKFPFKIVIFFLIAIIFLALVIFLIVSLVKNNGKKDYKVTENENIVNLNSELDSTYSFAREGDYIVALRKKGNNKRIYNLSQGTGSLGDFLDYTYYDKKLYFLFGTNNIYSISLTEGNGVYELEKEYNYTPVVCLDNTSGSTSGIVVTNRIIYFNNSKCGLSGINYKNNSKQVNLKIFNSLKNSSLVYSDSAKALYYQADDMIYKVDEKSGEVVKILDNANGDIPLTITDNVLLYTITTDNKYYNYYGYNVVNGTNGLIAEDVRKLVISSKKYFYYNDGGVYVKDNNKVKEIYKLHYNVLSNMELINDSLLQIVDTSTIGDKKVRIVNIDLSNNKYESSVVNSEYELIRMVK